MRSLFVFGSVISSCWIVGCGRHELAAPDRPTRPESTESKADEGRTSVGSPVVGRQVELIEAKWDDLQKLVAERQGKVVVVDVWSTACEPCMKEFPHLIELQKRYPEQVVAISFDVDYAGIPKKPPQYYRERVVEFLGSQAENQVIHRMCTTAAEDLFNEIKLDSIPAIYVYDKTGMLAKRFEGVDETGAALSYEKHVTPLVDSLVK